ncbi:hypothetical protein R3P38DRAFT_3478371 [Favolaschia claudopus]|uniref:Uncharacterized protein n=1 Tax=Favolaschia claudopus TaxID=2862362 RepID=A0AAV9Z9A7_9AGAR
MPSYDVGAPHMLRTTTDLPCLPPTTTTTLTLVVAVRATTSPRRRRRRRRRYRCSSRTRRDRSCTGASNTNDLLAPAVAIPVRIDAPSDLCRKISRVRYKRNPSAYAVAALAAAVAISVRSSQSYRSIQPIVTESLPMSETGFGSVLSNPI